MYSYTREIIINTYLVLVNNNYYYKKNKCVWERERENNAIAN